MITASVQTAQDAAPLTFGVVLVMVAAMVLLVACVLVSAAVVEAFRRRANRVVREAPVPPSNVRPLTSRHGVRVVPQSRRWEA